MARTTDAALTAGLRRVAEELIRPEDVRRGRDVDQVISGGRVRADRIRGNLPPNATGVVQAASVQAPAIAGSDSRNVAGQLADLAAGLGLALIDPLTQEGALIVGGPSGTPQQLVRGPNGTILGVLGGVVGWYASGQLGIGTTSDQGQLVIAVAGVGHSLTWDGDPLYWTAPAPEDRTFLDTELVLVDDGDQTKRLRFGAGGITAGTERTLSAPDKSGTLAVLDEATGNLAVSGTVQAAGLRLDVTTMAETITPTHTLTISINGTDYKLPIVAA